MAFLTVFMVFSTYFVVFLTVLISHFALFDHFMKFYRVFIRKNFEKIKKSKNSHFSCNKFTILNIKCLKINHLFCNFHLKTDIPRLKIACLGKFYIYKISIFGVFFIKFDMFYI
jgi:hypothetical protein